MTRFRRKGAAHRPKEIKPCLHVAPRISLTAREGRAEAIIYRHSDGYPERAGVDLNSVHVFNMLTIKGIYGREMYETWYKMNVMIQSGLDISPVITHRFRYDEFERGFEAMQTGESGKVILNWGDET